MTPYWVEMNDLLPEKGDETRLLSVWEHARYVEVYKAEDVGRLPKEMPRSIILFKECENGHGRLTATTWLDEGCHWCRIAQLEGRLRELGGQSDHE